MHSSKVLKDQDAENVAFDFKPEKFPVAVPEVASDFLRAEGDREDSGFKLNPLISGQIGVSATESKRLEAKVEKQALEKLKEVQEQA